MTRTATIAAVRDHQRGGWSLELDNGDALVVDRDDWARRVRDGERVGPTPGRCVRYTADGRFVGRAIKVEMTSYGRLVGGVR